MNVRQLIQEYAEDLAKHEDIDPSVNLFDKGYLTSVHVLDLLAFIEENFEFTVDGEDLTVENFGTIDSMVAFVERVKQPA
jgi:methoxymalonate biosynthesis acyl carrier protein